MSRQFDAKHIALGAHPHDQDAGVELFLQFLDVSEKDFIYEEGMTAKEYIYGKPKQPERG